MISIFSGSIPEPVRQVSPVVSQSMAEAAAWCARRLLSTQSLRSPELDPSHILNIAPWSRERESVHEWGKRRRDSHIRAVEWVNQTRSQLLRAASIVIPDEAAAQSTGKLLLYEFDETVTDGASEASSRGFYDMEDAPPWDTWFLYFGGSIFCYVPQAVLPAAQAGIDANPVGCIHWRDWSELARYRQ